MKLPQKITDSFDIPGSYRKLISNKKTRMLTIIASIVYIVNPFDIIPDFLIVAGLIDDSIVAFLLISSLLSIGSKPADK
jgi:uncharacterized membrane protein YkvA (DUF1232 family)